MPPTYSTATSKSFHTRSPSRYLNSNFHSFPQCLELVQNVIICYFHLTIEYFTGNVVCQDHISAALALLVHSREITDKDLKNMIAKSLTNHWREGVPHQKQDLVLMRFATNSDKRDSSKSKDKKEFTTSELNDPSMDAVSKNPWGDLCQSWGVYDHQEVWMNRIPIDEVKEKEVHVFSKRVHIKNKTLARRLGKRTHEVDSGDSESSSSDSQWTMRQKAPRMRMHADDEESKNKGAKSPICKQEEEEYLAPLSIEVVNTDNSYTPKEFTKLSDKFRSRSSGNQKESVHSRLGIKVNTAKRDSSNESVDSDHNVLSRVHIVTKKSLSTVWSRLEKQAEASFEKKDLRHILKSRKNVLLKRKKSNDLRDRLDKGSNRTKEVLLRVEIDNDYHNDSE